MAFSIKSRVVQTTTTTGTGSLSLIAPASGARSFASAYGDGNSTAYMIVDGASGDWELTIGTVTAGSPDTLSRAATPLASSDSGAKISFAAGTKSVFSCHTGELTPYFAAAPSYSDDQIMQRKASAWVVRTVAQFADDLGLADVATSGDYDDLDNAPALATVATTGAYSDLTGKPSLATVATSGAYNDLTGKPTLGTAADNDTGTSGGNIPLLNGTNTWSGKQTLSSGGAITPASPPATTELGYLGMPLNTQNGAYTTVMGDAGKMIYHTSGSAHTHTIAANASVAYPIGTIIAFSNENGGGIVTIAINSDTLRWGSSTGSRSLAANGTAYAHKKTSTLWRLSGEGIS